MKKIKDTIKKPLIWFKNASRKKKIIIIIIILVILFFLRPKKAINPYTTDTVKRGTIEDIVSESGNVTSGQVAVSSFSTGVIEEIFVNNGDVVSAGENLFQVKSTATPEEKASAYATYASAVSAEKLAESTKLGSQAQLEKDREAVITAASNAKIMQDNVDAKQANPATKKSYTQNDIDAINSALTSARETFSQDEKKYLDADTSINSSKAQLSSAWLAYQATQDVIVTAPIAGTVENLSSVIGDQVSVNSLSSSTQSVSSTTSSSGPVLYIVPQSSAGQTLVRVQLNEVDFPKVKLNQKVIITIPALQNKTFTGSVIRIDKIGTDTSGVITFNVIIEINNPDEIIASNMTVNVDIQTEKHTNVLTVPNSAIKPYKGGKAVQVYDAKKKAPQNVRFVPVTIGIKGIDSTEIIKGVKEGTVVVTGTTQTKTPAK